MLAIVTLALTLLGIAISGVLSGGAALGSPFLPIDQLTDRYSGNELAVKVASLFQFGAAVPLGILSATLYARQLRLGIRVPGPAIGLFGGIFAAVMLAISALVSWTLSQPELWDDPTLIRAIAVLSFLLGGVGYAAGIGLLVAGVAVPALILRLTPRWLAWSGLVIAALSELSFLSLLLDPLQPLIPVARFGGGIWLIVLGFLLPATRAARTEK